MNTDISKLDGDAELAIVPEVPKSLDKAQVTQLDQMAEENARKLAADPNDRELVEAICNIGRSTQASAAANMDLLKVRVGDMLKNVDGGDAGIVKGLTQMRLKLQEIDPYVSAPSIFHKLFSWFPGYDPMRDRLLQIGARWETAQDQINGIELSLRNGQIVLSKDCQELTDLYEKTVQDQNDILANAYLAGKVYRNIEDQIKTTDDSAKKKKLENVLYDVMIRVQTLKKMGLANEQFLVEMDMTIQDNQRLIRSVDNTLQIVPKILTVALAIQAVLQRQKKIAKATDALNEYAGDTMLQTARAVRQGGKEIALAYSKSVVVMSKLMDSQKELLAAMDEQDKDQTAALEAGKKVMVIIDASTTQMRERREGKTEGAEEIRSLEASITSSLSL